MTSPILITTHADTIHLLHLSPNNDLSLKTSLKLGEQPSFALPHPSIPNLVYITSWVPNIIYAVEVNTGLDGSAAEMKVLGQTTSGGEGPTYFIITDDRKSLLIANYRSGSITRVALDPKTGLFPSSPPAILQFPYEAPSGEKSKRLQERQEGPHAHHVLKLPSSDSVPGGGEYVVCELGGNKIYVVKYDDEAGWGIISSTEAEAGFGPRHAILREVKGKESLLYVVNELVNLVTTHRIDKSSSTTQISPPIFPPISTLPPSFAEGNYTPQGAYESIACAILLPTPNRLIVTNRNADASIAPKGDSFSIFSISEEDGSLTRTESVVGAGRHLRGIGISLDGEKMLLASREGDGLSLYEKDGNGNGEGWKVLKQGVLKEEGIRLPVGVNWL